MKKCLLTAAASGIMLALSPMMAHANTQALINLEAYSGVTPITTSCSTCHTTAPALNAFGVEYFSLGGNKNTNYVLSATAQSTLFAADTDNDGVNNLAELQAGTNPAGSGATSSTSGTASVTGCVSNSLSTPLMMVLAMLSLGFLARRKKVSYDAAS